MRRSIFLLTVLFLISSRLFSQGVFVPLEDSETESAEKKDEQSGISYSNEKFSWKEAENAASYFVEIKIKKGETWETVYSNETSSTQLLVPLKSGSYQITITPVNILGKRGQPSKPLRFKVLDNSSPYLSKASFKEIKGSRKPVLIYRKRGKNYKIDFARSDIMAAEGHEDNVFTLYGKNIFDDDTVFALYKLKKDGSHDEKSESIPLTVVEKKEAHGLVYVSCPVDKLTKGDFEIVATKKNGNTSALALRIDTELERRLFFSSMRFGMGLPWNKLMEEKEFEWYNSNLVFDFYFCEFNRFDCYCGCDFVLSNQKDSMFSPEFGIRTGLELLNGFMGKFELFLGGEVGINIIEVGGQGNNNLWAGAYIGFRIIDNIDVRVEYQATELLDDDSGSGLYIELGYKWRFRNKDD